MPTLQHLALNCIDPKKQEAFYTKHLGFRRVRVFNAGQPNEFAMLRLGGACLEFFKSPVPDPRPAQGESPVGFKHLAIEVEDIEAKIAELNAAGIQTEKLIDCNAAAPGLRVCFFRDPEGNRLEIMENWTDDETLP
jgi:glyoxylase I family protein